MKTVGAGGIVPAKIVQVKWVHLLCRVRVEPIEQSVTVDIRIKVNDASSSKAQPKNLNDKGEASLAVADDSLAGTSAVVVLLDAEGNVIAKQATTIGGEE